MSDPHGQDPSDHRIYHQQPPARSRVPYNLQNRNCGTRYKSIACITRRDVQIIGDLWRSEQATINGLLAQTYYYRMNVIHSKGSKTKEEIIAIFAACLCSWKFSIHELYKRYALRKRQLNGRDVDDLNFFKIATREINSFIKWLKKIGKFENARRAFKLWKFGCDDDGKPWLMINQCEYNVNYFQLFNAIHDNLYQWRNCCYGLEWLRQCSDATGYRIS